MIFGANAMGTSSVQHNIFYYVLRQPKVPSIWFLLITEVLIGYNFADCLPRIILSH